MRVRICTATGAPSGAIFAVHCSIAAANAWLGTNRYLQANRLRIDSVRFARQSKDCASHRKNVVAIRLIDASTAALGDRADEHVVVTCAKLQQQVVVRRVIEHLRGGAGLAACAAQSTVR
jgi:hypothetical protein